MVTAGVFLIIRGAYFVNFSKDTLFVMVLIGLLTTIFSGLTALGQ